MAALYCRPVQPGVYSLTDSASTPRLRATFAIYLGAGGVQHRHRAGLGAGLLVLLLGHAGIHLVALACLGRIWTSVFIAGHKDVDLVTTGPYARCRHPLYAASWIGALGLGVTTRSLLLCVIVVVLIAALVIYAASCEEQFLADAFPEGFKAYVKATPNKWWPGPAPRRCPNIWTCARWCSGRHSWMPASFFLLYLLVAIAAEYRLTPAF